MTADEASPPSGRGAEATDGGAERPHGPPVRRLADWDADRLAALAREHGTPLYVTDLDRVRANYRRIDAAFPDADVMYAAKANTASAVLAALVDEGAAIECAAAGEVERAIAAGCDPNDVQYTGVNPPDEDLDRVVAIWEDAPGLTVNVGARDSVERLADRGFDGRLCLRVNPGIAAGHHEKVATGTHPKFGLPIDEVPEVAAAIRGGDGLGGGDGDAMELAGLHAHMGSGLLSDEDLDAYERYAERMAELARTVGDLDFLDIGGGFGVPYREEAAPLDLDAVARRIRDAVGDLDPTLAIEPGRYVVADAATILTRVNTVKETSATTVVGVDASMTTLIRPAMYGAYHPIRNCSSPDAAIEDVTVGGPVCESSDVFCTDRPLPRPEGDDLLAIGMAGAYGYAMASQFHSQPRPADVALEDGAARVIRERETLDDVTRLERK